MRARARPRRRIRAARLQRARKAGRSGDDRRARRGFEGGKRHRGRGRRDAQGRDRDAVRVEARALSSTRAAETFSWSDSAKPWARTRSSRRQQRVERRQGRGACAARAGAPRADGSACRSGARRARPARSRSSMPARGCRCAPRCRAARDRPARVRHRRRPDRRARRSRRPRSARRPDCAATAVRGVRRSARAIALKPRSRHFSVSRNSRVPATFSRYPSCTSVLRKRNAVALSVPAARATSARVSSGRAGVKACSTRKPFASDSTVFFSGAWFGHESSEYEF